MIQLARDLSLFPRNAIVIVLRAYKACVSPLYGPVCRFHPSCSSYALTAVQNHGVTKGALLTTKRLFRCHPWTSGGIDDVPPSKNRRLRTTEFGFVVQLRQRKS